MLAPAPSNPFATISQAAHEALEGREVHSWGSVPDTRELRRILALPRRPLDSGEALAEQITAACKTPWGTMKLRPIQALALAELCQIGGIFAPVGAGEGKTLVSLLAADFAGSKRPLLIVPANLVKKTQREFEKLKVHWQCLPARITIISYETLSRANASAKLDSQGRVIRPGLLETIRPDLIIFDEVHKVRNRKAAVTRKVTRYLKEHPGIKVVAMSGTLTKRSIRDYSHIARWSLKEKSPVPQTDLDLDAWSGCLDEKVAAFQRVKPGALKLFAPGLDPEDTSDEGLSRARQAYRDRLVQSYGVVASSDKQLGISLRLFSWPAKDDPAIDQAFEVLRTRWETPDGENFADPLTLWRHANSLGLGVYSRWNPRPPEEWLVARKAWNQACMEILKTNRRNLYSELQVVYAVALGLYPEATEPLANWRKVKGQYDPNKHKEAVWVSGSALDDASRWIKEYAQDGSGIVWTWHVAFAEELARVTGLPYYGAGGEDSKGRQIEDAEGTIIASVSNGTGRNLQKWSNNLVMSAPPNGPAWEQLLARTHRPGQEADEVNTWLYESCWEAVSGIHQARKDGLYNVDSMGSAMRLCYCDWDISELADIEKRGGFRWNK